MLRELFRAAYRARHPNGVERTVHGVRVRLPASIARGVPETIDSEILPAFLEAAPNAVVYDVGANVGVWTALALARGAKYVVAIEPSTACVPIIGEVRDLYDGGVLIMLSAAGDGEGLARFTIDGPTAATNHLGEDGVLVQTRRIDRIARGRRILPDVVKIDVEGAEAAVLRGMSELERWPLTLVELHWSRATPEELLATGCRFTTLTGEPIATREALLRCNAVRAHRSVTP